MQIRVQCQCQPLPEDKFRHIIADNYYHHNHFWFELDHAQTSKLTSLLKSSPIAPGNSVPQNTKWMAVSRPLPSRELLGEREAFKMPESELEHHSTHSSMISDSTENDFSLNGYIQPSDTHTIDKEVKQDEKDAIFTKLMELALTYENQDLSLANNVNDTPDANNICSKGKETPIDLEKEENPSSPFEYQYSIAQVVEDI